MEKVLSAGSEAAPARRRQRNLRGEGSRLSDEIVSAALAIIERTGSDEAVTLRAVAREVGIAAPSIYPHFADADEIVTAVVARVFGELTQAVRLGSDTNGDDRVDRLVGGCQGYVHFGLDHPARYGVLFSERENSLTRLAQYCTPVVIEPGHGPVLEFGAEAFAILVQAVQNCVDAGASASTDVVADSIAVWVGLHGLVSLRTTLPRFPWPDDLDEFVRGLVLSLAKIRAR
jgi:AcrR family transcriptional regulator